MNLCSDPMKKIEYFSINYSLDPKVIGENLPPLNDSQLNQFVDPENNSEERTKRYQFIGHGHIPGEIDLEILKMDDNAIATDVLNSSFFNGQGLFVSEEFYHFLEGYDWGDIKAFRSRIVHLDHIKTYYFLSFARSIDCISFEKSNFIADKKLKPLREGGNDVEINSYDQYISYGRELRKEKGFSFAIIPITLALTKPIDILQLPFDTTKLVSERLKYEIEKRGYTGVVFEQVDIEFFLE